MTRAADFLALRARCLTYGHDRDIRDARLMAVEYVADFAQQIVELEAEVARLRAALANAPTTTEKP